MAKSSILQERMATYAYAEIEKLYQDFDLNEEGLSSQQVIQMHNRYGKNIMILKKNDTVLYRLRRSFINPFTMILIVMCIVSFLTDTILSNAQQTHSPAASSIMVAMIFISGTLRFIQEYRSKQATQRLMQLTKTNVMTLRNGSFQKLSPQDIVVGDRIHVSAGDCIPADVRFIKTSDLFVSQAAITGESSVREKTEKSLVAGTNPSLSAYENLGFMGTTIISGSGDGIVLAIGKETLYGNINLYASMRKNKFEVSATSIAWVLLKFMAILIPLIFVITGISGKDWITSFLFSLSVAIGLTPEMLPMVITTCLTKGALAMSKDKTIVKNMNAMQTFGSMDVLCMDKTGTLTKNEVLLEYYMNVFGNEDDCVLDYAYLNSYYHSGASNHIDRAILKCEQMPNKEKHFQELPSKWKKVDEIPFDYNRKCVSILLETSTYEKIMITKGSVKEVCDQCTHVLVENEKIAIEDEKQQSVYAIIEDLLDDGIKVVALAIKQLPTTQQHITAMDEHNLILVGYLAFFDAPKKTAREALHKIHHLSVKTKILSGDNKEVTLSICKRLGMEVKHVITGKEMTVLTDDELRSLVETHEVFAELMPSQKVEVVLALRNNGHTVGFLGDGINDVPALSEADVGISVDNAIDAAKEIADVILLEKDLNVLEKGILEGRKTFVNMTKYIHISASSNFGNIFSIVCASIFLPFFPIAAIQLILLNLFYDMICIVLPWDKVDPDIYQKPSEFSGKHLSRFMVCFGLISSIFDILTFLVLYFIICPAVFHGLLYTEISDPLIQEQFIRLFQSGWFMVSMWTQILVIYMLRTKKIPFLQSTPSKPVCLVTLIGVASCTALSYLPISHFVGMSALPPYFYLYLLCIVVCYMLLTTFIKTKYIKHFHKLY